VTKLKPLAAGTRVRLRSASHLVELRSDLGRVVRADIWDGYYIVRLDQPALYHDPNGSTEELTEIREAADNMDVLAGEKSATSRVVSSGADQEMTRGKTRRIS